MEEANRCFGGIRMPSFAQPPSVDHADGGELRYRVARRVKQW
jgi:hypothetical protein